jgi:hypothetical protein
MTVRQRQTVAPWLLLTFSLPTKRASQRVEVWRLLRRYGVVALGNSGYLLPNQPANRERFQWLSSTIRSYGGEASVVEVQAIDNLSAAQLAGRFTEARIRDYQRLIKEIGKIASASGSTRHVVQLKRVRSRFQEIVAIDFFQSPTQKRVADLIARVESGTAKDRSLLATGKSNRKDFQRRAWVTRPRPGIDRSASAWLILRFIDPKARFVFAKEGQVPPGAIPFDMYHGGFGHRGEDCTFETLRKEFRIRDSKVGAIGEMVHDADLGDGKFGRKEAYGVDEVLKGWARKGTPDKELLDRGVQMIEGLYHSMS